MPYACALNPPGSSPAAPAGVPDAWLSPMCNGANDLVRSEDGFNRVVELFKMSQRKAMLTELKKLEALIIRATKSFGNAPTWPPGEKVRRAYGDASAAAAAAVRYFQDAFKTGRRSDLEQAVTWIQLAVARIGDGQRELKALESKYGLLPCTEPLPTAA